MKKQTDAISATLFVNLTINEILINCNFCFIGKFSVLHCIVEICNMIDLYTKTHVLINFVMYL